MNNLEFTLPAPDHNKLVFKSIITNLLVTLIIFLPICYLGNVKYAFVVAIIVFIVQYFKSYRWNKFFISNLKIYNDYLTMTFFENGKINHIEDRLNNFGFKKKIAFNRTGTSYLVVLYKGNVLLKQFEVGGWTEDKFKQISQLTSE